jgi:RNA recognition motif-containing protein
MQDEEGFTQTKGGQRSERERKELEMGRKLYVGNLPYETGETELQELFGQFGSVDTVRIMRDMATGRARGFGFVEMTNDGEAQTAIAKLNAYPLGGRVLTVNEARPKPEYAGGGFGGGYGGGDSRRRSEPRW